MSHFFSMNVSVSYTRQGPANVGYIFMIIGVMLIGAVASTFLVAPLLRALQLSEPYNGLLTQCLSALLTIGLPAWLTEYYYRKKTYLQIYTCKKPTLRPQDWLNAVLLVILGVIVSELTVQLMELFPAPSDWLRDLEEMANQEMERLLGADDLLSWLLMLLAIVIIAPITEELLFRGALMGWSIAKSGRIHMSVWLIAAVFSAVHMEWSGLPGRLILGALLGYCAVYGGLRMSVLVHALNNLIALVGYKVMGEMTLTEGLTPLLILLGLASAIGIVYIVKNMRKNVNNTTTTEENNHEDLR